MGIYTADSVFDKGTIHNSYLTYAAVSLCFGDKDSRDCDTEANEVRPNLSTLSCSQRLHVWDKPYYLLSPWSSHTAGLGPPWDCRISKDPERQIIILHPFLSNLSCKVKSSSYLHLTSIRDQVSEKPYMREPHCSLMLDNNLHFPCFILWWNLYFETKVRNI